jgi:cytochrome P450
MRHFIKNMVISRKHQYSLRPPQLTIAGAHAIRIAPNELHIDDVQLYKTIYKQADPFPKDGEFYDAFAGTGAGGSTTFVQIDPVLHKARRKSLSPYFSRQNILKMQPTIVYTVKSLCSRLRQLEKNGHAFNADNGFRCLTVDVISTMTSGKTADTVNISDDSFQNDYLSAFETSSGITWNLAYQPVLRKLLRLVPGPVSARISSTGARMWPLIDHSIQALTSFRREHREGDTSLIYSVLMNLSHEEATAESLILLIAGSDTTGYSLSIGFFHICNSPSIKKRLVAAIDEAFAGSADVPSLTVLETIPYLSACVKESLRVAQAVPGRLPRVVPKGADFVVDGQVVPPGTVVGMSAYTMHHSREIWGPNADDFEPDRWLAPDGHSLDQYMCAFSKGARGCLAQNLALAEMYITIAMLFRQFDFTLDKRSLKAIKGLDRFTIALPEPGVLLRVKTRA